MLFADNICEINMHRYIHVTMTISCQPTPLLPSLLHLTPLHEPTLLFTYLEILLLLLLVQIPIHSCPWLAINFSPLAASPTPRHPIDQDTYLHRRHQQHQPSRLTQARAHNRIIYAHTKCTTEFCTLNKRSGLPAHDQNLESDPQRRTKFWINLLDA
jgi:hypothetical protein